MAEQQLKSARNLKIFCLFLLALLAVLTGRLAWLQIIDGKLWSDRAREQLQETRSLQTPRGSIYDRNGKELAISHMAKSLYANPREVQDADGLAKKLAPLLQLPEATLRDR